MMEILNNQKSVNKQGITSFPLLQALTFKIKKLQPTEE